MTEILVALGANILLGVGAYLKRSVSESGLAAGICIGTLIFYFGGPESWLVMGAFFISSSVLTKYKKPAKNSLSTMWEKGGRRDYLQVLANGGIGCAAVVLNHFTGNPLCIMLFAVAFAASNADTWASEIGALSKNPPVSIITLKPVPRGTSGGVSILGLSASLAGSALIAAVHTAATAAFNGTTAHIFPTGPYILAGGVAGSLIDSILGATVQGQYRRDTGDLTERSVMNGKRTALVRGFAPVNNDMVNFLSSLGAVLLMLVIERSASFF